jgi:ABC-type transport system involved in cytochrome bd biosynthesis fused ATPase/permease subunit
LLLILQGTAVVLLVVAILVGFDSVAGAVLVAMSFGLVLLAWIPVLSGRKGERTGQAVPRPGDAGVKVVGD